MRPKKNSTQPSNKKRGGRRERKKITAIIFGARSWVVDFMIWVDLFLHAEFLLSFISFFLFSFSPFLILIAPSVFFYFLFAVFQELRIEEREDGGQEAQDKKNEGGLGGYIKIFLPSFPDIWRNM